MLGTGRKSLSMSQAEENELFIEQTRKRLNSPIFNPAGYLDSHVQQISVDGADPEKKMFALFDKLSRQFTQMSQEIEEDVTILQDSATHAEKILMDELQSNADKLVEVGDAVDGVKLSFDLASEGAVRIGGKLSSAERERSHIDKSVELLGYLRAFQNISSEDCTANIKRSTTAKEIRGLLPAGLQQKDWGYIAQVLHDLQEILYELSADDVRNAQNNIAKITDRVEQELMGEFDKVIIKMIHQNDVDRLVDRARELALWLHLFCDGHAMQRRYLFTVVQHRIPTDPFFQGSFYSGGKIGQDVRDSLQDVVREEEFSDEESDGDKSEHNRKVDIRAYSEVSLVDQLSGLFSVIDSVCQEQFTLIRKVFPPHSVAKVTRMLIQRIFNDPAFGLQARVDAILCPEPPAPPLSLPDHLDALVIVREKLSALYLLLIECSSHPSMRGMGNESAVYREAPQGVDYEREERLQFVEADEEAERILHSDAEIRQFFDEQISQVFLTYRQEYFDKEALHVRTQYAHAMTIAAADATLLTKPSAKGLLQLLPLLRSEKVRSVELLVEGLANNSFLNKVFSITTDAASRMESIGRDDKKLPLKLKELFLLQMAFLETALFLPWCKACVSLLLKLLSTRASADLPSEEYLVLLSVLTYGVSKIKSHFEEVFLRPLNALPNIVAVCKESRMKVFKTLDFSSREVLYCWTLCIVSHIENLLTSLQSRYDYTPKTDASHTPSTACEAACKDIAAVVSTVRAFAGKLEGLDLVRLFWRPMGQQLVGLLISHVRKQKVNIEGASVLRRDILHYLKHLALLETPDVMDMLSCLKDATLLFSTPAASLLRLIGEDLRYMDTAVVMALVRSRSDFNPRDQANYCHQLGATWGAKWDAPLPWEGAKTHTAVSIAQAAEGGTAWTALGPSSLRKAGSSGGTPHTSVGRISTISAGRGESVAVDLAYYDEHGELQGVGGGSSFLPSRPGNIHVARRSSQAGMVTNVGNHITRPDLIISGEGSTVGVRPTSKAVSRGSAATLLAVGETQQQRIRQQQQQLRDTELSEQLRQEQEEDMALRKVQLQQEEEDRERAEILALGMMNQQAKAAQPPKKLMKKISSFFGSK
ncbi:exocyst complex component Sec10-domain-containing protein [Ochromonadaceae sp. CCMP2298]|nr:exocyst complex component Sec10-domain-containing protein [Ochromonadaceae sp. CCMP2298]|mmetsp:Transcript_16516/g.36595  ORF Transcript_16516/g.36595 Transcript_16516/m.36595 type:complete len:1103 (-) Transcript_16516:86-3394(-)|eukprot:CAMPEP_0173204106 /NCGR_PEP_ID=MMETSP1141-20130122/19903_1 /TAXON_ID=483371 /ORGANISM="non described non described, Strain CCMP2298" /LENGTH=1102 /DNA_ID=CAMNT_0014129663 /DNA_START=14 /DNA_END=3322 /DNA_ORIENTATION=+